MPDPDFLATVSDLCEKQTTLIDEINDAPSEFFSPADMENVIKLFQDMGVTFTCDEKPAPCEEEADEKSEDLVQVYFRSIGTHSVLSRDKESELTRGLQKAKITIRDIVSAMPLYKRLGEEMHCVRADETNHPEEESDYALVNECIERLADLMAKFQRTDIEIAVDMNSTYLKTDESKKRSGYRVKAVTPGQKARIATHIEEEVGMNIEEFKAQWNRITNARRFIEETKNELVTHNLKLVVSVAKRYIGRGMPLLDLIQEGNIGLMKAVEKFNPEKGFKLSTYATWWIRQAVTRAFIDQGRTIRIPVHLMEFRQKVMKYSRDLRQCLGREPYDEEIARELGVSVKKVEEVFGATRDQISLQDPVGEEGMELIDTIGDTSGSSPYDDAEKSDRTKKILSLLETLTPKEELTLLMRFGIGFDRDYTLAEVGRLLSVTRERIRQIEASALAKLRHKRVKEIAALTA